MCFSGGFVALLSVFLRETIVKFETGLETNGTFLDFEYMKFSQTMFVCWIGTEGRS